jgi:hypothetical protein
MAKPGEEIRVIVLVEDNATAEKLMETVGALGYNGKSFSVIVTREDGALQTHDLCYRDLLKALWGYSTANCPSRASTGPLQPEPSKDGRPEPLQLSES